MHAANQRNLLALTSLPTVAGCEQRVIQWTQRWARRRKWVAVKRDRFGNMLLSRCGAHSQRPIIFTAHMDHPGFVIDQVSSDGKEIKATFRGGVADGYFKGATVRLHDKTSGGQRGRIMQLHRPKQAGDDKQVTVRFASPTSAAAGTVMTWDIPPAKMHGDRLHAPACDDLAGMAAVIGAFAQTGKASSGDVRVLLTRAEEVGFIGAIGACKSGLIPRRARLIALENSKSFADSPIGGGPIARVGDRASTFDPALTYRLCQVAQLLAQKDKSFKWQRCLMSGGTCEATAYQTLGFTAACICLPLGNYHNMAAKVKGRYPIVAEVISLCDYHNLIAWLIAIGKHLDDPTAGLPLTKRLENLFAKRKSLLT